MENMKGLLKIRIKRGIDLAIRDTCSSSSDPYVVVTMGTQKVKTKVIKSNCNPEWNEEHSLSVTNSNLPLKLTVFDKDKFSKHDKMGEADIDLQPYFECVNLGLGKLPVGTAVKKIQPDRGNCLADESKITWIGDGKMVQDMLLKLQNVERGKLLVQIQWVDLTNVPGANPNNRTCHPFSLQGRNAGLSLRFSSPLSRAIRVQCSSTTGLEVMVDEEIDRIKRLQNGSDVRGVALQGEKGRTVDLTPPAVEAIAESFGEWVLSKLEDERNGEAVDEVKVSVGRDPRVSGGTLSTALFSGLGRAGCLVFDMGLATTPACFMSTLLPPFEYDASIMMTASHLPWTRNGLKFFTKKGGLTSIEVEEICDRAARKYANRQAKVSKVLANPPKQVDFMSCYARHLRDIIKERVNHPLHFDTPLEGFQIIVNAGNGSGGFFTWDVLDKLGADTFGSLHLNPDGMFPNHIPNPEDKKAMALTRAAVLDQSADLGIVFDTDVDRSGVVDSKGNPINGDRLIALMSAIVLREHPGTTIVTDARTSVGLSRFIASRGGRHCLYRVGYRNVIDKGVQLNKDGIETHLMMETSGHGALKENHFLDDGAYMVVKIIIEMVRMRLAGSNEGIGNLIQDLEEPLESVELRMDVISDPRHAKAKAVEAIETFRNYVEEGRIEGWELDSCGDCWVNEGCLVDLNENPTPVDAHMYRVKVLDKEDVEYGWVHLRQSIHNPNIAVNMQSSVSGGCHSMAITLRDKFLAASGLDKVLDVSQVDKYSKTGKF